MKASDSIIAWLLEGDPSIVYQTQRDLLGTAASKLKATQAQIARYGWGKGFLDKQQANGHWGRGSYRPKWICTHYTLLDLLTIGIEPTNEACQRGIQLLLASKQGIDRGLNYARTVPYSDVCINGMILNMASYFSPAAKEMQSIVDYLLERQFADGGWNCMYYQGATHSSFHSTIGVMEGFAEYQKTGNNYRKHDVRVALARSGEFLQVHKLCRSDKTNTIVDPKMQKLAFPCRWKYDILRALDLFWSTGARYDNRMTDAIDSLLQKRLPDGRWPLQLKHPGQTHFEMERVGKPSRWNTLRALRVLKQYGTS